MFANGITLRLVRALMAAALCALSAAAVCALTATAASAHEFWIEPQPSRPRAGEAVSVRLFVGERFAGEELPYERARVVDFSRFGDDGSEELTGEEGVGPASVFTVESPGVHVIAYRSAASSIVLPAEKFNSYLLDDGLYEPLARRREAGTLGTPGRERYARYAKTIVVCGDAGGDAPTWRAVLGHRLEICLETDPAALAAAGVDAECLVLFEGRPLAGAVVFAAPQEAPDDLRRTMTGADGACRFALDRPGLWMISLVHMVPCADGSGSDWDSSWATLIVASGSAAAAPASATRESAASPQSDRAARSVTSSDRR